MELKQVNIENAANFINDNARQISAIRSNAEGMGAEEVSQCLLMDKYELCQLEAAEIVDALKEGATTYATAYQAMAADREKAVKQALDKSTEHLNEEERTRYLASMLTALQLASSSELTQAQIDAHLNANMAKSPETLTAEITRSIDTLPVEALAPAVESLDADAIKAVADAMATNTAEYRLLAATQLYCAQRDGELSFDGGEMPPLMTGAIASAAIDLTLASAKLKQGEIKLETWQEILKCALGALLVVASLALAGVAMFLVASAIVSSVVLFFGTGLLALIVSIGVLLPLTMLMSDKAAEFTEWVLEALAPVYDIVVVKVTSWVKKAYTAVTNWVKSIFSRSSAPSGDDGNGPSGSHALSPLLASAAHCHISPAMV